MPIDQLPIECPPSKSLLVSLMLSYFVHHLCFYCHRITLTV